MSKRLGMVGRTSLLCNKKGPSAEQGSRRGNHYCHQEREEEKVENKILPSMLCLVLHIVLSPLLGPYSNKGSSHSSTKLFREELRGCLIISTTLLNLVIWPDCIVEILEVQEIRRIKASIVFTSQPVATIPNKTTLVTVGQMDLCS